MKIQALNIRDKVAFINSLDLTHIPSKNVAIIKKLPCKKHQGCSRIVIYLNDKWVLKVAKNDSGLYDNYSEWLTYNLCNKYERRFLCKVLKLGSGYTWIIQERVLHKKRREMNQSHRIAKDIKNNVQSLRHRSTLELSQLGKTKNSKYYKIYDYA